MTIDDNKAFVAKIAERLKRASNGDRMYERPMTWEEADKLVAYALSAHKPVSAGSRLINSAKQAVNMVRGDEPGEGTSSATAANRE